MEDDMRKEMQLSKHSHRTKKTWEKRLRARSKSLGGATDLERPMAQKMFMHTMMLSNVHKKGKRLSVSAQLHVGFKTRCLPRR